MYRIILSSLGDIEFIESKSFSSECKRLNLPDEFLNQMQKALSDNPKIGPVIEGTLGARKVRVRVYSDS